MDTGPIRDLSVVAKSSLGTPIGAGKTCPQTVTGNHFLSWNCGAGRLAGGSIYERFKRFTKGPA